MRRKRTGRPVPQHVRERSALRRARLRKLGYESYSAYLSSPHWRSLKARYRASDLLQRCMCGERSVHFHHKTYERLGAELLTDLTPLCRVCHDLIHLVDRSDALGCATRLVQPRPTKRAGVGWSHRSGPRFAA
jgi:5-methylcytosine-specific restriction endonuclease McrA